MSAKGQGMRYELKYRLPVTWQPDLRQAVARYVDPDPYCAARREGYYTVRSIYFDTDDMTYYFEKKDSVKVRKKLRVRTYNHPDADSTAFIEIKRKFGRRGMKERLSLPLLRVDDALNGKDPLRFLEVPSYRDRKTLGKIRFLMHVKSLKPVVLVTYDREAFVGRVNARDRLTFDCNIRSQIEPQLEHIFREEDLKTFENEYFVLELKFDDLMPSWMARIIKEFNLVSHSYSKYCHAIDAWPVDQQLRP